MADTDDSMDVDGAPPDGSCADEADEDLPDEVVCKMRRLLSCKAQVYLSLSEVYHGCIAKLRFTILMPCPRCKVANHLPQSYGEELHAARTEVCAMCRNTQCGVREVFKVYAPIGTRQGSSAVYQDQGNIGYHGVRGDVAITFLDEPHEHFLRVEDDLIVCYQIDKTESINGVVRSLKLELIPPQDVILKTIPGQVVKNNDVFYVAGLGLPNPLEHTTTGNLYVIFFVKDEKLMNPVKLDCIRAHPAPTKSKKKEETGTRLNDIRCGSTSTPIENGRSPKKSNKRKKRRVELGGDSDNREYGYDSEDRSKLRRNLGDASDRMSRADIEKQPALDMYCLSFLDRIVYRQTIPMPHLVEVDEIPMSELRRLWDRIRSANWWKRVVQGKSYSDQGVALRSAASVGSRRPCGADAELPVFEVVDSTARHSDEVMAHITGRSAHDPDYPSFTLKKLARSRTGEILCKIRNYLTLPEL